MLPSDALNALKQANKKKKKGPSNARTVQKNNERLKPDASGTRAGSNGSAHVSYLLAGYLLLVSELVKCSLLKTQFTERCGVRA
jgi:hypothetical protein